MFCGVLHSRAVYADTQMRVHKALIVDYRIGCKFSLSLREKNFFVVQGGQRLTEISRSRNRLSSNFWHKLSPSVCSFSLKCCLFCDNVLQYLRGSS